MCHAVHLPGKEWRRERPWKKWRCTIRKLEGAKEGDADYPGDEVFGDYLSLLAQDSACGFQGGFGDGQVRRKLIHTIEEQSYKSVGIADLTARELIDRKPDPDYKTTKSEDTPAAPERSAMVRHGDSPVPAIVQAQRWRWRIVPVVKVEGGIARVVGAYDTSVRKPRPVIDVIVMSQRGDVDESTDLIQRAKSHLTNTFSRQLDRATGLVQFVNQADYLELLREGLLDDYFGAISDCLRWIGDVKELIVRARRLMLPEVLQRWRAGEFGLNGLDKKCDDVKRELEQAQARVTAFCSHEDRADDVHGEQECVEAPDAVFVLGCQNVEEQQCRVRRAIQFLHRAVRQKVGAAGDLPHVVVCGGMQCEGNVEANVMEAAIRDEVKEWPKDRLHSECFSLDTVGNAVLGLLLLKRVMGSAVGRQILIITSDFHAARALTIFMRVLSRDCKVAVIGVRPENRTLTPTEMASGLTTERQANRETFSLPNYITGEPDAIEPGHPDELLMQLILRHGLYRGRYDLLKLLAL